MRDWGMLEYTWWALTFLAATLMWAAQVPPKQVLSNVAEWAVAFGVRNPPDWLKSPNADRFVRHGATLTLVALGTLGFFLFFDAGSMRLGPKLLMVLGALAVATAIVWNYIQPGTQTPGAVIPAPSPSPTLSLDHAFLVFGTAVTEKKYDPFRMVLQVGNVGRLPTTKANLSMEAIAFESVISSNQVEKYFSERAARASQLPLASFTVAPRQPPLRIALWANVAKQDYEDITSGKKYLYVFLAADYVDGSTPEGRRIITEVCLRSIPNLGELLSDWTLVRTHSYIYE